jgi:hypothetical protein
MAIKEDIEKHRDESTAEELIVSRERWRPGDYDTGQELSRK